jgi:hypothetical protein
MDFAESDQQRLSLNHSSDPADIADASAEIAAANSSRWLGLPPSSPPSPSSPLQSISSDLDFMNIDTRSGLEGSTPNSESDAELPVCTSELENLDAVDPFELFSSLGLSFPQDENHNVGMSESVGDTDPQQMAQGMRELISGCVL